MKFDRITPRSTIVLIAMLAGFGLLTVCLMFATYITKGSDLAMLVATGATSISVPIGGLLVLLAASWQRAEAEAEAEAGGHAVSEVEGKPTGRGRAPLIDRSIVLIGNGYEHLSLEASPDALRISTGEAADGRPPAAPRADGEGAGAATA